MLRSRARIRADAAHVPVDAESLHELELILVTGKVIIEDERKTRRKRAVLREIAGNKIYVSEQT